MKPIWIAGIMGLTLAGLVALGQRTAPTRGTALPAPESGPGTVQGIVRRLDTMEPIDGATVMLNTGPETRTFGQSIAITDRGGGFKFPNVAFGTYNIRANRTGYFIDGAVAGGSPAQSTVARIATTVSASQTTANVILELVPGAVLTGRVYDPARQLMPGIQVAPLLEGYVDGHRGLFLTSGSAISDDRGEFRIFGLAPGEYYLRTTPRAALQNSVATTYYPSGLDARSAQSIVLRAGREAKADIHMLSASPVRISGRVVAQDPTAVLAGRQVQYSLMPRDAEPEDAGVQPIRPDPQARGGLRTANGEFELQVSRPPGLYDLIGAITLQVDATRGGFGNESSYLVGRVPIDLRGKDIEGLVVTMLPTVDLRVRVVSNGDTALSRQLLPTQLRLRSREPLPLSLPPRNAIAELQSAAFATRDSSVLARVSVAADASGEAKFSPVTEGRYFLDSAPLQLTDAYIADIRQGGRSIYEDGTIVVGKGQPEPVEVILARTDGTIQGVVQDATGKAVAAAQVILVPNGRRRENPLFYKIETSAANGQFTLRGLAPGQYKIFAWESIPSGAERNAQFMERFEQYGRALNVSAGSTTANVVVPFIRKTQ